MSLLTVFNKFLCIPYYTFIFLLLNTEYFAFLGLESCSKTKNSRNTEASLTMSEHPVRRSRRQCYVKRLGIYH